MNVQGSKRRKMSSYIPEDEFTQNRQSIDLVSLTDIKIEYTLVLSHLRLSTHIKDLQEYGKAQRVPSPGFLEWISQFADMALVTRCNHLAGRGCRALHSKRNV